jgi:cobalamin biosynthesis protein CobT
MSLFPNATMKKMSAMSFYKTIPGVHIDGDLTEEEKKTALESVEPAKEEDPIESDEYAKSVAKAFEEFKANVSGRFANTLKGVSTMEIVLAVANFQQSVATMADKFTRDVGGDYFEDATEEDEDEEDEEEDTTDEEDEEDTTDEDEEEDTTNEDEEDDDDKASGEDEEGSIARVKRQAIARDIRAMNRNMRSMVVVKDAV